jgi:DeoR/GlpR family transcriptional regulator of sugar metabolism
LIAEQRRTEVLRLVRARQAMQTSELAAELGVSEMTIRRDLDELAEMGLIRRVRGGALQAGRHRAEPPFEQSRMDRAAEKERVGVAAARLVQPGDTIILDVGTTALQLARQLHGREGLTVVTNNLAVYEELLGDETVDIVLLGGLVRRNYRSLVGFLTEDSLAGIRADLAFIGISGVSDDLRLFDTTLEEIPTKRVMLRAAKCAVLLADGAKFGGGGLGWVADIEAIDVVVTTDDAPAASLAALRERGLEVRTS